MQDATYVFSEGTRKLNLTQQLGARAERERLLSDGAIAFRVRTAHSFVRCECFSCHVPIEPRS